MNSFEKKLREKFTKIENRFFNRELSWLEFNSRVLQEANNKNVPLLERVKYLSISASNLNEFYMIRVAGIKSKINSRSLNKSRDGLTPQESLQKINHKSDQVRHQQQLICHEISQSLREENIIIEKPSKLSAEDMNALKLVFEKNILFKLTPIIITQKTLVKETLTQAKNVPFIANLSLSFIFQIQGEGEQYIYSIVTIPKKLKRFIKIDQNRYILIEDVINLFSDQLFPNNKIIDHNIFHVTRDSDIEIEKDAEDLMTHLEDAVKKRQVRSVISLDVMKTDNDNLLHFLLKWLQITSNEVTQLTHAIAIDQFIELYNINRPDLKYYKYKPKNLNLTDDYNDDYFTAIKAKEILLHHPYQTFDAVVDFIRQAANDPDVIEIKQTLYRTSTPIIDALIEAAQNGKLVTVVIELKARLDEEANIKWAQNLRRAGVKVSFGFANLKIHAKIIMVIRKEDDKLKSYVHFGTGNYHPDTAKIYSDLSFFTCDEQLCLDAYNLFSYLTNKLPVKKNSSLIVSPNYLRENLTKMIKHEAENAKKGLPAAIWAKLNSLIDPQIIDELYKASMAGVKINLIVRGICGLKPGIAGFSDNITVKSIIGRYLEHSRIICFANGGDMISTSSKVFISSADWMQRNLNRRIETMIPINNEATKKQILQQIMLANINDERQSWYLQANGTYRRKSNNVNKFAAHDYFMNEKDH